MQVTLVVPAYNEEKRIHKMLTSYVRFYATMQEHGKDIKVDFIVVLNACADNTRAVVDDIAEKHNNITVLDIPERGKGNALKVGFLQALKKKNKIIGFVDADGATQPEHFNELVVNIDDADGIIASRYMPGATVMPPRPAIKTWGRKLFFNPLVRLLFGLNYYDTQCGAKLFKREVIEKAAPLLSVRHFACDVDLLYHAKKQGFTIIELPTTWHDQEGSTLQLSTSGLRMLGSLIGLWWRTKFCKKS